MGRGFTASEEQLKPDPVHGDLVLSRFINCIMKDGKKTRAQRVVYGAFDLINERLQEDAAKEAEAKKKAEEDKKAGKDVKPTNAQLTGTPEEEEGERTAITLFHEALENVRPNVEVRSRRVGGTNYQVPTQVSKKRAQSLAFRWIIDAVRSEKGRPTSQKLARELWDASHREGRAMNKRDQTHRMADANKAFAHFAW